MFKDCVLRRMIGYFFLPITALLLLPSCSHGKPKDVSLAYDIMHEHAYYMKQKHQARIFGIGGGFPDKITVLSMSFRVRGPLNVDKARVLMISSTQHLLQLVNQNEKIRPYLDNYPFTSENLEYSFFIDDENGLNVQQPGSSMDPDNLAYVSNRREGIAYSILNSERDIFQHIHEESYTSARESVLNHNFIQ